MATMTSPWTYADYDAHEQLCLFDDSATGLRAIIAIHSTHLGPAAGGVRYWHYARDEDAITDALRLSRGMSYKNAMADLPMGGGKGVILALQGGQKTPELLAAFGAAIDSLGGRYVTAEDVGMTDADMQAIATRTRHVSGLPVGAGQAGGDPGPSTAMGVFLGVKAAVQQALGRDDLHGVHVAIQGVGSVGGGLARHLAAAGARLTLADMNADRAAALAQELDAETVASGAIMDVPADVFSPNALGAILTQDSVRTLQAPIVAGGANNQLATPDIGAALMERGILYAPDYVINAGGIINVSMEYLGQGDRAAVDDRIAAIPDRLRMIWDESTSSRKPASDVADGMARAKIGRA
jgi:leucine dehydrogenase